MWIAITSTAGRQPERTRLQLVSNRELSWPGRRTQVASPAKADTPSQMICAQPSAKPRSWKPAPNRSGRLNAWALAMALASDNARASSISNQITCSADHVFCRHLDIAEFLFDLGVYTNRDVSCAKREIIIIGESTSPAS
jgi:hypothetical protein